MINYNTYTYQVLKDMEFYWNLWFLLIVFTSYRENLSQSLVEYYL